MEALNELLSTYGLWLVFFVVLLDQGGVPIPAWPPLVVASAQAVEFENPVWPILMVAAAAALLADMLWYGAGRRHGARMLRLICRISLSPDSCVSGTRDIYARWGPPSLVVAKFIPGFAAVGTTLAGHQRTPLMRFAFYDGVGALLWVGVAVVMGVVFHDAVNEAVSTLESLGRVGIVLVAAALVAFLVVKALKRRLLLRELRMERISVSDLHTLMDARGHPLIIDARSQDERATTGWIPGSIHAPDFAELTPMIADEVVVYCDCPNEVSAARVAGKLKKMGFRRVRPLAGGLEAWRLKGLPLEGTQAQMGLR